VLAAPPFLLSRPLLDALTEGGSNRLPALWASLRGEFAADFRFDALDLKNLAEYLNATGRVKDAEALRALPGFPAPAPGEALNNYGSRVDLAAGLIAHIVMDGKPRDLAAPSAEFRIQGATATADRFGKEGGAYRFNGKSNLISVSGNAALRTVGSLTVGAWIRPRVATGYAAWISQPRGTGWGSTWRVGFGASPTAQWGATTLTERWTDYWVNGDAIQPGQWTFVAAVFDQTLGTLRLYHDGKLVKEFFGLKPWAASGAPLLIGVQRDDGIYFDGEIGEIKIYNRTLNAAEVAGLQTSR
jgi:hypothetical protein